MRMDGYCRFCKEDGTEQVMVAAAVNVADIIMMVSLASTAIGSELAYIMESDAGCSNIWYMNALNSMTIKRTQNEKRGDARVVC
jgi:hypothetical protein